MGSRHGLQATRGPGRTRPELPSRKIYLLQRRSSKVGDALGKSTGWIHRASLRHKGVETLSGVVYRKIDDAGVHLDVGGRAELLPTDTIVICAGQEPLRDLAPRLMAKGSRFT
jgi:2,4-dienoyl-CoA reductase (NADPH2)